MTAADVPAPGLTGDEAATVARFEAAEYPPEVIQAHGIAAMKRLGVAPPVPAVDIAADVREEAVARAIAESDGVNWDSSLTADLGLHESYRANARAALAAVWPPAADDPAAAVTQCMAWIYPSALGVEATVTGYGEILLDAIMPLVAAEVAARVQAAAEQRTAEVRRVTEVQYRAAWAAWEETVDERDEPTVESRIAWARMNQALSDKEAVAAALARPAPPEAGT